MVLVNERVNILGALCVFHVVVTVAVLLSPSALASTHQPSVYPAPGLASVYGVQVPTGVVSFKLAWVKGKAMSSSILSCTKVLARFRRCEDVFT